MSLYANVHGISQVIQNFKMKDCREIPSCNLMRGRSNLPAASLAALSASSSDILDISMGGCGLAAWPDSVEDIKAREGIMTKSTYTIDLRIKCSHT